MLQIRSLLKLGIGAKLGLSIGVGIVLVASIVAGDQYSNRVVSGLVAAADNQQEIVVESLTIDTLLRRAQIAGRDIRRAQTSEQITPLLAELDQVVDQARARMAALKRLTASNETDRDFNTVSELTLSYIVPISMCSKGSARRRTKSCRSSPGWTMQKPFGYVRSIGW